MFSNREDKIIKIIGKKQLSINDITTELFKGDINAPFDTHIVVSNSIRRVIKKCAHYHLDWTLEKQRIEGEVIVSKVLV